MDTPWWTRGVGQEAADKLRNVVQAAVPSPDSPLEGAGFELSVPLARSRSL